MFLVWSDVLISSSWVILMCKCLFWKNIKRIYRSNYIVFQIINENKYLLIKLNVNQNMFFRSFCFRSHHLWSCHPCPHSELKILTCIYLFYGEYLWNSGIFCVLSQSSLHQDYIIPLNLYAYKLHVLIMLIILFEYHHSSV